MGGWEEWGGWGRANFSLPIRLSSLSLIRLILLIAYPPYPPYPP
jgi:hypothetical protein